MTASAAPSSSRRGLYVLKLVCTDHACCSHSVSANNPCLLLATRMLACAHPTPALRDTRSCTHTRAPVRTRARERAHALACLHARKHARLHHAPARLSHPPTHACLPTSHPGRRAGMVTVSSLAIAGVTSVAVIAAAATVASTSVAAASVAFTALAAGSVTTTSTTTAALARRHRHHTAQTTFGNFVTFSCRGMRPPFSQPDPVF